MNFQKKNYSFNSLEHFYRKKLYLTKKKQGDKNIFKKVIKAIQFILSYNIQINND